MATSHNTYTEAEEQAKARRAVAATERWRAFAALPEAEGKAKTAIRLADETDVTIEAARQVLRDAPLDDAES
jgi:hypothetical protein